MRLDNPTVLAILLTCSLHWLPVHAQALLKGKELSETNLIQALTPAVESGSAAADDGEVRLRSIRPARLDSSAQVAEGRAVSSPAKKPSASVLITFVSNSAELTERARDSLDVVARALQVNQLASFKFSIEGHADARGEAQHNLRLSQSRAENVVTYLSGQHNISRDRLKPVGKGDTEPVNTVQIDAPENRRVTIVTLSD